MKHNSFGGSLVKHKQTLFKLPKLVVEDLARASALLHALLGDGRVLEHHFAHFRFGRVSGRLHARQRRRYPPEQLFDVVAGLGRGFDEHHVELLGFALAFVRRDLEMPPIM